ncbi:trichothecene 8-O-acetyltransferase [Nemania abortiva]|nr:trichothecene 8-O-acetyltransferase [Nemania abortiva]
MNKSHSPKAKRALISPLDRLNSLVYLHWSLVLQTQNLDEAVRRLTIGLSHVASAVPYLKGHVSYPADANENGVSLTTRLMVSWGSGDRDLTFREHRVANNPHDVATMKREGAPAHFFPTEIAAMPLFVDVSSHEPQPVFDATFTPIDGGLVLNMCVHHGIMDGRGLATLTEMWANFTRIEGGDELNTCLSKRLPDPDEPLTRTARLVAAAGGDKTDGCDNFEQLQRRFEKDHAFGQDLMALLSLTAAGPKCGSRIFTFSSSGLQCAITTNSILSAVIWSSITRIRLLRREQRPPTTVSRFSLAVDGRRRLGPLIDEPGPYLGNVVLISSVDVPLDVLEPAGTANNQANVALLAPIVEAVASAGSRITADHISGLMSTLQHVQDTNDVGPGWLSSHQINFMSSSWANLLLYGCDFGSQFLDDTTGNGRGTPVFVRYPYAEYNDGNIVVLPRRRKLTGEDEGFEVYVMLDEIDLETLAGDVGFRSWLKT